MEREYVISNGNLYLTSVFQFTKSLSHAGRWDYKKAMSSFNYFTKSKKAKNMGFRVQSLCNEKTNVSDDSFDFMDIKEVVSKLTTITKTSEELMKYNTYLEQQYRIVSLEISDIEHYIEFAHVDACKGYKAFKLLQDKLNVRRQIKDEQLMIENLSGKRFSEFSTDNVNKSYMGLDSRQYQSRALHELFE